MDKNIIISDEELTAIKEVLEFAVKSKSMLTLACFVEKTNPLLDLGQLILLGKYESIIEDFLERNKDIK